MKLPFENIIAIDIETTSTDPKKGSIVQLGAVVVNENFEIEPNSEFSSYIKPLNNFRDPSAMSIHGISENILDTAPYLGEVLDMFEVYCGSSKILASWGNYFDVPFLFEQYQKINRECPFSHRSIDLKSIAIWESARKDIPIRGGIKKFLKSLNKEFEGESHDALNDIRNTIKLLQELKK